MGHFLLSMLLLGVAAALHWRTDESDGTVRPLVAQPLRQLSYAVLTVVAVVLVAGTVVTGSGPHSGDARAARTGFNPESVSQLHADLVMLLVGLSIAMWLAVRAVGGPSRDAGILVVVVLGQGAVGWTQYFTDLPVALVAVHMAGACLVLIAACRAVLSLRERIPAAAAAVPSQSAYAQR
jgi:cytochrome c oxidase assembly protein subunit 15